MTNYTMVRNSAPSIVRVHETNEGSFLIEQFMDLTQRITIRASEIPVLFAALMETAAVRDGLTVEQLMALWERHAAPQEVRDAADE